MVHIKKKSLEKKEKEITKAYKSSIFALKIIFVFHLLLLNCLLRVLLKKERERVTINSDIQTKKTESRRIQGGQWWAKISPYWAVWPFPLPNFSPIIPGDLHCHPLFSLLFMTLPYHSFLSLILTLRVAPWLRTWILKPHCVGSNPQCHH